MFDRKGHGVKKYRMYGWFFLVVMVVGIAMWQYPGFGGVGPFVTATGFARIKPHSAATMLTSGGNFVGVFTNGVGKNITLTANSVTISGDASCNATAFPLLVPAGSSFKVEAVTATACTIGTGVTAGEFYDITVSIPYEVVIDGVSTRKTENGIFRGRLE